MLFRKNPPKPIHVKGVHKGEEFVLSKGREPGRGEDQRGYRDARDSTSINAASRQPLLPQMPNIPPA